MSSRSLFKTQISDGTSSQHQGVKGEDDSYWVSDGSRRERCRGGPEDGGSVSSEESQERPGSEGSEESWLT